MKGSSAWTLARALSREAPFHVPFGCSGGLSTQRASSEPNIKRNPTTEVYRTYNRTYQICLTGNIIHNQLDSLYLTVSAAMQGSPVARTKMHQQTLTEALNAAADASTLTPPGSPSEDPPSSSDRPSRSSQSRSFSQGTRDRLETLLLNNRYCRASSIHPTESSTHLERPFLLQEMGS